MNKDFNITNVGIDMVNTETENGIVYGIGIIYSTDNDGNEREDVFKFLYNIKSGKGECFVNTIFDKYINTIAEMLIDNLKTNYLK